MKARRWWIRKVRLLVGLAITLFLLDGIVRSSWVERPVARLVESFIELATGERAVVGAVSIEPSVQKISLEGLILSHTVESGLSHPILATEHLSIRFGIPWGGAWIRDLVVTRPVLHLHVDEGGLREFRNLELPTSRGNRMPWDELSVENARINIDGPMGSILFEGINVSTVGLNQIDMGVDTIRLRGEGVDEVLRQVVLPGITVSPDRVIVPQIDVASKHVRLRGSIAAMLEGPLNGSLETTVDLALLDGVLEAGRHFEGVAHIDVELGGTTTAPVIQVGTQIEPSVFTHEKESGKVFRFQMQGLSARSVVEGRTVDLEELTWSYGGGKLGLIGSLDLISGGFYGHVSIVDIELRKAIREGGGHPNSWTNLVATGDVDVAGTLSPFSLEGSHSLVAQNLSVGNGAPESEKTSVLLLLPEIEMAGSISVASDGVRMRNEQFVGGSTSGTVEAFVGFGPAGPLDLTFDFDRTSLATFRPLNGLNLWGQGWLKGRVVGPFKDLYITGKAGVRNFEMAGLTLADEVRADVVCDDLKTVRFQNIEGRLGSTVYRGDADVRFGGSTEVDIGVEIEEGRLGDLFRIGGIDIDWVDGRMSGMLGLHGDPSAMDGDVVMDLRDIEVLGERFPAGAMSGWIEKGRVTVEQIGLSRANGEESLLVRGSVETDWTSNLDIVASGLRIERLNRMSSLSLPLRGELTLDAQMRGSLLEPKPQGRIALRDTWFESSPVADSTVQFSSDESGFPITGHLVGDGLSFDGHIGRDAGSPFTVHAELDGFPIHTVYPVGADGSPIEADLTATLNLTGTLDDLAEVDIAGRGRSLSVRWDRHALHTVNPWDFAMTGRALELSGFRIQGVGTDVDLTLRSDDKGLLSGGGGGVVDSDLARMIVPGLERADGSSFLNVAVGGAIGRAKWEVDGMLCGVTVQGDWFPHPVEEIYGLLKATEDETLIQEIGDDGVDESWLEQTGNAAACLPKLRRAPGVNGRIGDGRIQVLGGFTSTDWIPDRFSLTGDVRNARIQYLDFLPPAVGDAALTFDGPVDELLLSGDIEIREMVFSDRIEWENSLLGISSETDVGIDLDAGSALFAMDLTIESQGTVRIRNNVADLTAGGELRVVGDTNQPGIVGNIRALPGGSVYLKEREFELQRGDVLFVDPFTFDPDIDILLATDVRSREEEYDIAYRISGTYNDWRAETRSDPSLPQADVNALLLFGMTRAELERYGGLGGALAVEGGDLLASSVLFSGLNGEELGGIFRIVDPFRPDRLDLVSGVSERGSGIVSSELRLLYENEFSDVGLPGTRMIFEQNISRASDTYLGLEQRLARTLYARTYWGSEQQGRHLGTGGAYGLEMKVRWELD